MFRRGAEMIPSPTSPANGSLFRGELINLLKFLNMRSEIGDDPRIPKRFLKMISNSIFVVNDKLYFQIMTADVTLKIVVTGANFIEVWRYKNQHKI